MTEASLQKQSYSIDLIFPESPTVEIAKDHYIKDTELLNDRM